MKIFSKAFQKCYKQLKIGALKGIFQTFKYLVGAEGLKN